MPLRDTEVRHLPEMDDGKVVGVIGLARDLSAPRAAARQLYLLNHALDNVYDAIYLMKGDSADFVYVNEAASRSLGYSRQELMSGMGALDIDPGLNRAAWTEMMRTMKDIRQARVESTHRSRHGYRVLEAETAATALDVFRMRGDEVALLLTDLVMPGTMSGRHLAEKLVAERPKLKVLFTSGYSPDVVNRLLHFAPGQLLQKPYTAAVLATTVRRCLDATP